MPSVHQYWLRNYSPKISAFPLSITINYMTYIYRNLLYPLEDHGDSFFIVLHRIRSKFLT